MQVAVIDSKVALLKKKDKCNFENHGTNIARIILNEAPNIEVLSYTVLSDNNKGNLSDLIEAIADAVKRKVDIINMSLGFTSDKYRNYDVFRKTCIEAQKKGIILVSAFKNGEERTEKSYPAIFDEVIGVGYDKKIKDEVIIKGNNIFFSSGLVYIPGYNNLRIGSSYLAAYVTGIVASQKMNNYYDIIQFFRNSNGKNIFFNKSNFDFYTYFRNKKFYYWGNINNVGDLMQVEEYYLRWAEGEFYDNSNIIAEEELEKIDVLILGIDCNKRGNDIILTMILKAAKQGKDIIMPYPYINTKMRTILKEKYKIEVLCLYL